MNEKYVAEVTIDIEAPRGKVWDALTKSGKPDLPENYQTVHYELSPEGVGTRLTLTQDNNASQEEADHAEQNWNMVLEGMKKLLEN